MFSILLKPETIIISDKVIKKSNFNITPNSNGFYYNNHYYYVFDYKEGKTLDSLPVIDILKQYIDFLCKNGKYVNGNLFLPYDDIMNLSNYIIHDNIISKIDVIDDWWCCYGNISIQDIVDSLLTRENKIKYIYKLGYFCGQQCSII